MSLEIAEGIRWIRQHTKELQQKYANTYIAVYRGKVIAADEDMKKVYEVARPYGEKATIKFVLPQDLIVLHATT